MRWKVFNYWNWHSWFAWHPVVIDGCRVWLERVERKVESCNEAGTFWAYRLPGQIDLTPRQMALAGEFVKEGNPMCEAIEMASLTLSSQQQGTENG